jgi:hypothetical protein
MAFFSLFYMKSKAEEVVPEQSTGAQSNTESTATFNSVEEARSFFEIVKERLQQVGDWHSLAGKGTAAFELTDEKGDAVKRPPQKGDHLKIDIPGPGPRTGDGFDWVQVEAVEHTEGGDLDCLVMQVRPATNPKNDQQDVAHFFSDEATSNFMVKREGTTITAAVYGRNEKPNTSAEKVVDKARNTAVATGAVSGFSKLQWKSLVTGFLKKD